MSDQTQKVGERKKTHQEVRYEEAEKLTKEVYGKPVQDVIDQFEKALLAGEKKGVTACLEFLVFRIQELRKTHANGVANHIQQGVKALHTWAIQSSNFRLLERPSVETPPPRKFFGQQQEEQKDEGTGGGAA